MSIAQSKITRQGQVTVPAEIRKRLGLAPGSTVEWREVDGEIVVARASKHDSREIHEVLFPVSPRPVSLEDLDEGIRSRMRRKHEGD